MGVFSRISEIVNANINAMLDKAENPEKMVKLMIHEMEDTLAEVKSAAAEVVADRLRVERALKHERARHQEWTAKAELAVSKDRDDLARAALEQKMAIEGRIAAHEARLAEVGGLAKQYQDDIARLEEKLQYARERQRSLIANHHSAVNRRKVEDKIYKLNTSGAFAKFENYERRIDRFNAEAEVMQQSNNSLDAKFRELESDNDVESELAKLKAKAAGASTDAPAESTAN